MKNNLENLSHRNMKKRYLNMLNELEREVNKSYKIERSHSVKCDELEELHAAYGNAQKEISDLKSHNDTLIKQVKRLERRSGKVGKQLLKCKNELRNPSVDDGAWKKFNKANRSGKNE